MYLPSRRFFNADTGTAGGTATPPVDRGDLLPEDKPVVVPAEADPKVAELEATLAAEAAAAAEAAEAAETDDAKAKKPGIIPLERHQAVLDKERAKSAALAAEIAELKARGTVKADAAATSAELATTEASVVAMEAEYAQLLTDGQIKEATAVMAKIRSAERSMADARAELKIQAATLVTTETARYQTALARVEAAYPALNPDHETFDAKTEARVARLSNANQAAGMTPTAALQDAVETILGAETAAQENATTVTPRVPAKDVGTERKAEASSKAADAVAATPPSLAKVGQNTDKDGGGKLDAQAVIKMNQKDFATLSDKTLAELRGDLVA